MVSHLSSLFPSPDSSLTLLIRNIPHNKKMIPTQKDKTGAKAARASSSSSSVEMPKNVKDGLRRHEGKRWRPRRRDPQPNVARCQKERRSWGEGWRCRGRRWEGGGREGRRRGWCGAGRGEGGWSGEDRGWKVRTCWTLISQLNSSISSPTLTLRDAHDTHGKPTDGIRGKFFERVAGKPFPDGKIWQMDVFARQDAKLGKGREGAGPALDVGRNIGVEHNHQLGPQPGRR